MTPAPISVERFKLTLVGDINGLLGPFPAVKASPQGEYVRHSDYAALLHQLAERDAEVERLKSARNECERQYQAKVEETIKEMARAEAAERAREEAERDLRAIYEAVPGLPIYATEEDADRATDAFTAICHLCNEYIASDAAFLAASGGR